MPTFELRHQKYETNKTDSLHHGHSSGAPTVTCVTPDQTGRELSI